MFDLVVLNGSRAGARFTLLDVPAVVGRSPEAHLRLDDPWVSNMHALFEARGATIWVVDLSSRNGTFVGQVRVEEAEVAVGAQLAFGRTEVRIEPHRPDAGPDEPPTRTPVRFDPLTLTTRSARTPRAPGDEEPASGDGPPPAGPRRSED